MKETGENSHGEREREREGKPGKEIKSRENLSEWWIIESVRLYCICADCSLGEVHNLFAKVTVFSVLDGWENYSFLVVVALSTISLVGCMNINREGFHAFIRILADSLSQLLPFLSGKCSAVKVLLREIRDNGFDAHHCIQWAQWPRAHLLSLVNKGGGRQISNFSPGGSTTLILYSRWVLEMTFLNGLGSYFIILALNDIPVVFSKWKY